MACVVAGYLIIKRELALDRWESAFWKRNCANGRSMGSMREKVRRGEFPDADGRHDDWGDNNFAAGRYSQGALIHGSLDA